MEMQLLPEHPPRGRGFSVIAHNQPSRVVGGDFYDFVKTDTNGGFGLVIADVSGHNVGAALLMAEVRTFIQAEAKSLRNPSEILCTLNEFLYDDLTRAELFITMFYLTYDAGMGELSFANAGHNPPMVWRSGTQSCEWLDAEGLILGVKRNIVFEKKQVQLRPGDILLLYTDGITEATNPDNEMFGEDRLCSLLKAYHTLPSHQIIDTLFKKVRSFAGDQALADDISLVVMKLEKQRSEID